jgi:arsenate reductase-like glutaredoxin family protein
MIRFGMALMEMVEQLTKGFVKATGRQPDNLEKLKIQQEAVQRFKDMNKVVDMEGNVIDTSKGIMGGKQLTDSPLDDLKSIVDDFKPMGGKKINEQTLKEELMKTDNPFSDLVKTTEKGPKSLEQRRKEAEEALKNKNVVPIKDPEDMAQGGRAGFAEGTPDKPKKNKKITRREEDMGPYYETNDPEEALKEIVRRMINVEPAKIPLSKDMQLMFDLNRALIGGSKDIGGGELNFGINKGFGRDDTGIGFEFKKRFAEGGRIGLKDGMDRRTFMKIMGGLATLPIVGKLAKGAKLAAPAAKKVAEITAPALDKIVETVMSAGKLVSQSGRRLKELTTKKKLKDVEVEEDMMDGPSYTIKTKDKTIYYKPGRQDEMGFDDDIIEVIEDTVTKKASGGVARMLGE